MTDTATPVLDLRGLRKRFGTHLAVDRLDLALRPHEFMTFLGPSGSGKTTTLMMVAGLQRPDEGTIWLDGQPVDRLPPYRRDLGMVFQNYALFPHMSVRRNIAFPLEMRGIKREEAGRMVSEALRLVGLPNHDDRLPRELSGGQQQRVALARAMIYRPALLLMDEPLGALDKQLRGEMQIEIKRIHREREMSVLYVTHDQEEALTMSDRIAVFNHGKIEQVGTPAEIYENPATRFVASFIGETNFLKARVERSGHDVRLMSGDGELPCGQLSATDGDAELVVAIRPERMMLLPPGSAGLPGRVTSVIYLGNARKLMVTLDDGQACTVLTGADGLEDPGFTPGEAVRVHWDARHATGFSADA